MGRYIKKPRLDSEDEASARYWIKGLVLAAVWQALLFVVPFLLGLSAEGLATVAVIAVIVSAVWLRRNAP